jgi:divalent metal cation (Fe/Co/Zn/Cd) transporter
MRQPTKEERSKETSLFNTTLADIGVTALLLIVAITSGSLTMIGEAVRSVLMLSVQFYSIWVLFAAHRGRLDHYEFGIAKLEQFVWVIVGSGLVVGAFWVAHAIVETVFSTAPAAAPIAMAIAALVNGINLLINAIGLYSMYAASDDRDTGIFGAQVRARIGGLFTTIILQVTLTIAALVKDPEIALFLDAAGAALIVYFKLARGIGMISQGLPALLDAPAQLEMRTLIHQTIRTIVPENHIVSIRTRRCGGFTFAELTVAGPAFPSLEALHNSTAEIERGLSEGGAEVDLSVVVAPD